MSLKLPTDLAPIQEAIWLEQQLFAGRPVFNTGQIISIRADLRVDQFEKALRQTIAESPGLRLAAASGPVTFDLPLLDFRRSKDPLATARQWARDEMRRAIPLEDSALFRFALIRVAEDHWLWFQKYHHIIMDATSRQLLSERTARRYRALCFGEPLPALDAATPDQLRDAERRYIASDAYAVDRKYWLDQFGQWPGPLLEVNRQNTERAKSGSHARNSFTLKRADFRRLETSARNLDSSVFRVIIALAYVAFARLYDRYDLAFGLELANRRDAGAKQAIGFLARPLPMLLTLDRTMTIADAVRKIDDIRARNYPHRHFPVQDIARELGITRKGHHGLFDIIINYVPITYDFSFGNTSTPVEMTNLSYGFAAPWTVTIADTGPTQDLSVTVDTDPGLISAEMASRFASCMETLLLRGMDDPACQIGSLPIMPEAVRAQVLEFAAGPTVELPDDATLVTLCEAQAKRRPGGIALRYDKQHLSFAALHDRATHLARRLAALGVKPGVIVGIALPRTPDLVVAVLAVHKAGGAYLGLDPSYPAERNRFIVADTAVPVIITTEELAPCFADSGAELLTDIESSDAEAEMAELVPPKPDDLAYVIYTSGSTGRPKAVGIEHRNLINLVSWGRTVLTDAELHGVLFSTSLNFDLSAFELFLPLAFGGCMVMVENLLTLQSAPQRDKVRYVNSGPSLLDALVRANGLPGGVTTVLLAGERMTRHLADSIFDAVPGVRLINCYGPTETTVYSTGASVEAKDRSDPPIGRPIWNTTHYVLDSGGALLPPGIDGELFIGGAQVARGYLGRPELNAERFLPNPFGPGRLYRTGDRVRWTSHGDLEFVGRTDNQVKINGIRVELGEIEATLLALPGIAAAAVTLCEENRGVRQLAAYLVPSSGDVPAIEDVEAALERQLPRNMVPASFIWLSALPLTPNGKLDRDALPRPVRLVARPSGNAPPKTRLEREVAEIWKDVLQVSNIGVQSDFFDLGGDSLALVSLFASIEARFGRNLTVDVVSDGLTIERLAHFLANGEAQETMDPVVALQPSGRLPPFFCAHGIGGDILHLHRLAMHMGMERPFLGIRRTPEMPLTESLNQLAARYVDAMLSRQAAGPFYLGGHSFGGMLAYEMARQLVEQGHEIGLLAIIDQRRPGWRLTARNAIPALPRILANAPARLRDELSEAPSNDKFGQARRILLRWTKKALGIRPDVASMFDVSNFQPEQVSLYDAHIRALRAYRPAPLPVPITLIRADAQLLSHLALDQTLGWGELAAKVQVRVVPGNHQTITAEPFVRQLAQTLSAELDAAQGRLRH